MHERCFAQYQSHLLFNSQTNSQTLTECFRI